MRVAIRHPQDPNRPKMIAAAKYDSAKHVLWGGRYVAEVRVFEGYEDPVFSPAQSGTEIPEGFPGRTALVAFGFTTLEEVRAVQDFDEIPGIGQVTEQRIVEYLEALESE